MRFLAGSYRLKSIRLAVVPILVRSVRRMGAIPSTIRPISA
jgi:hypothetical protein